jgi:hypothetical protein
MLMARSLATFLWLILMLCEAELSEVQNLKWLSAAKSLQHTSTIITTIITRDDPG